LTVIREFASILSEGLSGPVNDKQQKFLGIVMSRVDDLALMVDDLLDTSKLESGLLGIRRRPAQAAEIIDHVRVLLDRRAEAAEITLECAVEDSLPPVYCDVEKIGRAIVNLAVNAIKFTAPSGRVRIWAKKTSNGQEVTIGVADNGPGIAPENLAAIFDRFKQVGKRVDGADKGFGLGLSIVRELVYLNLGTMNVESKLGRGSTFSFTLPLADPCSLFERYLNVVAEMPVTSTAFCSSMSLLTAELDSEGDAKLLSAADGFLQTIVGTYDLVYRLDERHWIMAVRRTQEEINALTQQIAHEWAEFGENRPCGALPALRLGVRGFWRIDRRRAELLEMFHGIVAEWASSRSARRVLLVDDDMDLVESLRIRMRSAGFDVVTAGDGREGIERASNDRPDAIVLDVRMPVLDGVSALRELKRRDDTRRIPVIMLSACVGERQLSKELGARFFIQKPFDSAAVISAVETSMAEASPV
jgi:CheY-like chemotaxis protein/two-component sensor histidine kinase